jgi:predicted  nucleic acid-binding Zn-ribbon protein
VRFTGIHQEKQMATEITTLLENALNEFVQTRIVEALRPLAERFNRDAERMQTLTIQLQRCIDDIDDIEGFNTSMNGTFKALQERVETLENNPAQGFDGAAKADRDLELSALNTRIDDINEQVQDASGLFDTLEERLNEWLDNKAEDELHNWMNGNSDVEDYVQRIAEKEVESMSEGSAFNEAVREVVNELDFRITVR